VPEPAVFQQVVHSRLVALSVSDGLARGLHINGEFPPLLGDISCVIARQTAPVVRTFDPPLTLTSFRNASGFVIVDGTYQKQGVSHSLPLGFGTYLVLIQGVYYQDAELFIDWPPPDGQPRIPLTPPRNLELLPSPAYPLPDVTTARFQLGPTILRGTVVSASGDGIDGATVEIVNLPPFLQPQELPPLALADWRFSRATTSAKGDWALVLPGRRYLDNAPEILPGLNPPPVTKAFALRLTNPDGTIVNLQRTIELGREFSLKATALRGQVVGPAGQPIGGAQVATSVSAATSTSRANGVWFLYFDFDQVTVNNVTVTVTTPGGTTASDSTAHLVHEATTVVPTFHLS
jgi:hypothetical protein